MNTTSNIIETLTIVFTIAPRDDTIIGVLHHAPAACPSLRGSDAAQ
jgi:hypothetical protein